MARHVDTMAPEAAVAYAEAIAAGSTKKQTANHRSQLAAGDPVSAICNPRRDAHHSSQLQYRGALGEVAVRIAHESRSM
jgi:hypothetical protein